MLEFPLLTAEAFPLQVDSCEPVRAMGKTGARNCKKTTYYTNDTAYLGLRRAMLIMLG